MINIQRRNQVLPALQGITLCMPAGNPDSARYELISTTGEYIAATATWHDALYLLAHHASERSPRASQSGCYPAYARAILKLADEVAVETYRARLQAEAWWQA